MKRTSGSLPCRATGLPLITNAVAPGAVRVHIFVPLAAIVKYRPSGSSAPSIRATETWMAPDVLLKTVTDMVKAVEIIRNRDSRHKDARISPSIKYFKYNVWRWLVLVRLNKSMVNQGPKSVRMILWYSLCEERGIFGDCASNMHMLKYL